MEVVFAPSNSANATAFTMENLFLIKIIIEKVTYAAKIASEFNFAFLTVLGRLLYV